MARPCIAQPPPAPLAQSLLFGAHRKEVSFVDQVAEVGQRTKGPPSQTKGKVKAAAIVHRHQPQPEPEPEPEP